MNDFLNSETRINLMRAFAGESQARNRYTFAQCTAENNNFFVLGQIFRFTANQEKAHAEVFYNLLKQSAGTNAEITAGYPIDVYDDISKLLETSVHNENGEAETIYPAFAETAKKEGFPEIATKFTLIAGIEKIHRQRFEYFEKLLRQDKLFKSDKTERWACLNCGYVHESSEPPKVCPVCGKNHGYFIRECDVPFTGGLLCQQ